MPVNLTQVCGTSDSNNQSGQPNDIENFVTGIVVALLGSTGEQLGLSLWKLAEIRVQRREAERRASGAIKKRNSAVHQRHNVHLDLHPSPEKQDIERCDSGVVRRNSQISSADKGDVLENAHRNPDLSAVNVQIDSKGSRSRANIDEANLSRELNHTTSESSPHAPAATGDSDAPAPRSPRSPLSLHPAQISLSPRASAAALEAGSDRGSDLGGSDDGGDGGGERSMRAWCQRHEGPLSLAAVCIFAGGNGLNFVALGLIQANRDLPPPHIHTLSADCGPRRRSPHRFPFFFGGLRTGARG